MTEKIADLHERVKAATGPDRELDAAIFRALAKHTPATDDPDDEDFWEFDDDWVTPSNPYPEKFYTASIDAALALVERRLPGTIWNVRTWRSRKPEATAWLWREGEVGAAGCDAATPPLAILAALLTDLKGHSPP